MPLSTLALIAITVLVSSFLSGVFGMAGGMILLGVLLVYYDVTTAMVLFSIIQFAANGWRAVLWYRYVRWPIFFHYVTGAGAAFAALRFIAYVPDKATVYFLLGIMPFMVELLPRRAHPSIEWRGMPFVAGVLTTVVQFMSGVGGVFLDIFFQKSKLDRKTTVATKAITQTFSHVLRAVYFGSFGSAHDVLNWPTLAAVALAIAATSVTPYVIERMTDHGFRQWTRLVIYVISSVYLVRAGALFLR
jgi:uncharacterized protein